jgi:hypothetical protein
LIKAGKTLSYAEADVRTNDGRLVAHGTSDQSGDIAAVDDPKRLQTELRGRHLEGRPAPGEVGDAHAHVAHERCAVDQGEQALSIERVDDACRSRIFVALASFG